MQIPLDPTYLGLYARNLFQNRTHDAEDALGNGCNTVLIEFTTLELDKSAITGYQHVIDFVAMLINLIPEMDDILYAFVCYIFRKWNPAQIYNLRNSGRL